MNGIEPEILGQVNDIDVPPILSNAENFTAYLEFDLNAESQEGPGGVWFLLSNSEVLTNVRVTTIPGALSKVSLDTFTGSVTSGHYVFIIGKVSNGKLTAQPIRFNQKYTVCSGRELQMAAVE